MIARSRRDRGGGWAMARRVDREKHEADKLEFLEALYDLVRGRMSPPPRVVDLTRDGAYEADIAARMGIPWPGCDPISSDLERDGKIRCTSSTGRGPKCTLTYVGQAEVEASRHARSLPVIRRGPWGRSTEAVWTGLLGLLVGWLLGVLSAHKTWALVRGIARGFGLG
jgi:hypothetical protein